MDVIRERSYAGRKSLSDRRRYSIVIAAHLPAIVDDDVLVAGIFHAVCGHGIGDGLDDPSLTLQANLFQLFHPMGGVWAIEFTFHLRVAARQTKSITATVMKIVSFHTLIERSLRKSNYLISTKALRH